MPHQTAKTIDCLTSPSFWIQCTHSVVPETPLETVLCFGLLTFGVFSSLPKTFACSTFERNVLSIYSSSFFFPFRVLDTAASLLQLPPVHISKTCTNQDHMNRQHHRHVERHTHINTHIKHTHTLNGTHVYTLTVITMASFFSTYTLVYMFKDTRMVRIYKQICKDLFFLFCTRGNLFFYHFQ